MECFHPKFGESFLVKLGHLEKICLTTSLLFQHEASDAVQLQHQAYLRDMPTPYFHHCALCTVDLCVCRCNRPPAAHVNSLTQSYIHTLGFPGFPNVKATDLVTLRIPMDFPLRHLACGWYWPQTSLGFEAEIPLTKNPYVFVFGEFLQLDSM